jgi:hypothetical protein
VLVLEGQPMAHNLGCGRSIPDVRNTVQLSDIPQARANAS